MVPPMKKRTKVAHLYDDRVTSLMMHPTADQFISAGLDGTIRLWDIRNSDTSVRHEMYSTSEHHVVRLLTTN